MNVNLILVIETNNQATVNFPCLILVWRKKVLNDLLNWLACKTLLSAAIPRGRKPQTPLIAPSQAHFI